MADPNDVLSQAPPQSTPPPGFQPLWGSFDGATGVSRRAANPALGSPGSGGGELDPLSRRLMQVVKALSVLLLLVVANSFLNDRGEESSLRLDLNPVARAAEKTQSLPGVLFTLRATYSSSALPDSITASGDGAVNSETGLSEARLHLYTLKTGRVEFESVGDGTSIYMRGNGISDQLPEGKEWMEVQPFLGQSEQEAMVGGSDGGNALQMLSSAGGSVSRLGRAKVDGVMTSRFRAVIDLADYADVLRGEGKDSLADEFDKLATLMPAPVTGEAWVDGKGLVRRSRTVMTLPTNPGGPALTMDMRTDFHDFGAQPDILLPDSSRVYDATPLLEKTLDAVEAG